MELNKMSKLKLINNILHSDFVAPNLKLEEPAASMSIDVDKRGCNAVLYKFDKLLGRDYKGGLFPFFAKNKGVCKSCDYIIFAEQNSKITVLVVELKKGSQQTFPQLKAAECFVKYIIDTLNRINGMNLEVEIKKVSIHEIRLKKRSTKPKEIVFDQMNHCIFQNNKFYISSFLN